MTRLETKLNTKKRRKTQLHQSSHYLVEKELRSLTFYG